MTQAKRKSLPIVAVDWAGAIRSAWHKSVAGIFECGRLLIDAKAALPHGAFGEMCERDLPFNARIAQMLMRIAEDPRLSNPIHGSHLPASYRTLYEITKLSDEQFEGACADGLISPVVERQQISGFIKRTKQARVATISSMRHWCAVPDLERFAAGDVKCGTVYADPAWQYGNQSTRGATDDHYTGMSVDEICALPVARIAAAQSHLHLWTTNAFLFDAKRVIEAWGFEYKSCFVWVKPQMGMGNYWRVSHEFMLLGVRGNEAFADRGLMSWGKFERRQHSAKPEEIRQLIEKASPGPRIELFARRKAPGWYAWGNEIERSVFDASMEAA